MGSFASVNGEIVPLEEARVPVLDNGFLFGDSVYEVLRTYGGRPFESGRHFRRLRASADRLGIPVPLSNDVLLEPGPGAPRPRRRGGIVHPNRGHPGRRQLVVRLRRGRGADGGHDPEGAASPRASGTTPRASTCAAVDVRRNHTRSLDPAIKSSNLLNNILALREAQARGAEEPVLLNHEGQVAEGASTNVFVVPGGALS